MGTETELQQGTCAKQLGEWRAVFFCSEAEEKGLE